MRDMGFFQRSGVEGRFVRGIHAEAFELEQGVDVLGLGPEEAVEVEERRCRQRIDVVGVIDGVTVLVGDGVGDGGTF